MELKRKAVQRILLTAVSILMVVELRRRTLEAGQDNNTSAHDEQQMITGHAPTTTTTTTTLITTADGHDEVPVVVQHTLKRQPESALLDKPTSTSANSKDNKPALNFKPKAYAVIAADTNKLYSFPLPIVLLSWRRIGVECIIVLIGKRDDYEKDPALKVTIRKLEEAGARIWFLLNQRLDADSFTLAQTVRMFAGGLLNLNLANDTILLTADADMLTLNLRNHLPVGAKKIFLYNSRAAGTQKEGIVREGVPNGILHIPLNTVAMPIYLWMEIMNFTENFLISGDALVERLYSEFNKDIVLAKQGGRGTEKWSIDQNLFSYRIYKWRNKIGDNDALIDELPQSSARVERRSLSHATFNVDQWNDIHLLQPMFGANWAGIEPALTQMFSKQQFEWCKRYHKEFVAELAA